MEPDMADIPEAPAVPVANGSSGNVNPQSTAQTHRMLSLRRSLSSGVKRSQSAVAQFLGVDRVPEENQHERQALWEARRYTLGRRFGAKPKSPARPEAVETTDAQPSSSDQLIRETLKAFKKPSVAELAWKRLARRVTSDAGEAAPVEGIPATTRSPYLSRSGRPEVMRMASFSPQVIEEVQSVEIGEDELRKENFFDVTGTSAPTAVPPAVLLAVQAFASAAEKRKTYRQTKGLPTTIAAAPLAQPEDETDIVNPVDFVKARIQPKRKARIYGMGFFSTICPQRFRRNVDKTVQEQMYELLDHRPFFTYWVTVVQTLILIVSLAVYGFAPVGFDFRQQHSLVLETSLALETVDYWEPENLWLGPRAAHLILLGAKYAPCMRPDEHIAKKIAKDRTEENKTACCVRNDRSGCVQTTEDKCSKTMATFHKWPVNDSDAFSDGRVSGSVCGLDPRYCLEPASRGAHLWPDDITKWPICTKKANVSSPYMPPHLSCEVVGHPCCIDIQGKCRITTREYCDFVKGYFHEDALLCSQVSCMDKICGMLPFFDPETPDQFYRLWTAIFLHAGVVHLAVTILFQYFIMRDTEKLTGFVRMALIYFISGIGGNLASSIFTPYVAEVGPAGSQFGVFACLIVEIIYSWRLVDKPWIPLMRMVVIALVLFILGLFPWTDNYSHIFGFCFGFFLSLALLPYIAFNEADRKCKIWIVICSLLAVAGLLAVLIVLFYVHPIYDCKACSLLNCIPFTENFCDNQKINITDKKTEM